MTLRLSVQNYLARFDSFRSKPLYSTSLEDIEQVVVIPALAESGSLFSTLASLSRNDEAELKRTLILCVINNTVPGIAAAADIADNQKTLRIIKALLAGSNISSADSFSRPEMEIIRESPIRLGLIDVSSPGCEMEADRAGVGMARKIGMDGALRLLCSDSEMPRLILSLDADTLVSQNYLSTVRRFFEQEGETKAAVIPFIHQVPASERERAAIYCYEIFLAYYVLGLKYAGSPYAFSSIGSAMVCTADAYVAVRGMNKRSAGEDFYFLNKLAKLGDIRQVTGTCVYPAARVSGRVPFGTGRRMTRFLAAERDEYFLYNHEAFTLLKRWLDNMKSSWLDDAATIMRKASSIDQRLTHFLEGKKFPSAWERIAANSPRPELRCRRFHEWFDGFKTMKLVRHLEAEGLEPLHTFRAVSLLLGEMGRPYHDVFDDEGIPSLADQCALLQHMRTCMFSSTFNSKRQDIRVGFSEQKAMEQPIELS
ncbi:MAG: glycosyltransferase family 2 protein [Smithellaceae bacterium]|nr:glycosyltransferase family 2 protein [Smithellaceae bacterium]